MVSKFWALTLFALYVIIPKSDADGCVPKNVVNISVDISQHLSWAVRPDEECEITEFLVYIYHPDNTFEHAFEVTDPWVDISFLEACEEWTFVVIAASGYNRGPAFRLVDYVPIHADADISLAYVNVTADNTTGLTHISWELNDEIYRNCSLRYRVTIENDGNNIIESIYVDGKFFIPHFLFPCTSYEFGVRAINMARPIIEGPRRMAFYEFPPLIQGPPTLVSVDASATSLTLSFRVEAFVRNPCPVREFLIDGGIQFNRTIELTDYGGPRPLINATFNALTPNSMYILRASVLNNGGWSRPVIAAVQTNDLGPGKA